MFIEAALNAVYEDAEAKLERLGDNTEVVQYIVEDHLGPIDDADSGVSSVPEIKNGGVER